VLLFTNTLLKVILLYPIVIKVLIKPRPPRFHVLFVTLLNYFNKYAKNLSYIINFN